ncbi:hypothetical protein FOZ63_007993, partial [Perkinsus olseni]
PFEFDEEGFPSGISNQGYGNESSVERLADEETVDLLFGSHISDAPANFHVRSNRALAELLASDPHSTVADEYRGIYCICQMLPFDLSPTSKWATIAPLVFVLSVTMAKDAIEDYRRYSNDNKADVLLVASSASDGLVYVETSQLDGERMFRSLPLVSECVGSMTCDAPNGLINEFNGLSRVQGGLREPADASNL